MDSSNTEKKWDVKREAKIFANLSFGIIKRMILKGKIKDDDLVWHAGMSGWRKAGEQEELKSLLNRSKKTDKELIRHKKKQKPSAQIGHKLKTKRHKKTLQCKTHRKHMTGR